MKKKWWIIISCLMIVGTIFAIRGIGGDRKGAGIFRAFLGRTEETPAILFFEETPDLILERAKDLFPGYTTKREKRLYLAGFLDGAEMTLAYDVQALPLVRGDENIYFYPLYEDRVLFATSPDHPVEIHDWRDLIKDTAVIGLIDKEPEQRFLWMNMAYGLSGEWDKHVSSRFLSGLYQNKRLVWDREAPIQITLYSHWLREHSDKSVYYPQSGAFAFEVGLLSHIPLESREIEQLKETYHQLGYLPIAGNGQPAENLIYPARVMLAEFSRFGEIQTPLVRDIQQRRKYSPTNGQEHHTVTLILIIMISLGISYVYKTVIHLGVRRGLGYIGFVLIGFMILVAFKYSYEGDPDVTRGLWYAFYLFILMLPPATLYILANLNCWDKNIFPGWLKVTWLFSLALLFLVATNDYHQQVFRFLTEDRAQWSDRYQHNWGYYVIALWMLITQVGAWIFLLRKSWDSPRKKMSALPMVVVGIGVIYAIMYNLKIPFFHEISLALAMSGLGILFWGSILLSGLVPSNSGYWELFESSRLVMQIYDEEGNLRFASGEGHPEESGKGRSDNRSMRGLQERESKL